MVAQPLARFEPLGTTLDVKLVVAQKFGVTNVSFSCIGAVVGSLSVSLVDSLVSLRALYMLHSSFQGFNSCSYFWQSHTQLVTRLEPVGIALDVELVVA